MNYLRWLFQYSKKALLLCIILGLGSCTSLAQEIIELSDFEMKAKQAGVNIESIKSQSSISRYDVTKLLNAVECTDCIIPSSTITNYYTSPFWNDFILQPGRDFRDIRYKEAIYNQESYYYCVATVADNEYMHWYPILVSPTCPGNFCGAKSMTKGEFAQIIVNILNKYIANNYTTNRTYMKKWLSENSNNAYITSTFNQEDKTLIDKKISECSNPNNCSVWPDYFRTYLKYCMYDLEGCDMGNRWWIGEWYWPIAELNILYKEEILFESNDFINTIHNPIDGRTAVETLSRVFPKTSCIFNNDYDCDGIPNHLDNCPYSYNPSQKDMDGDTIGDVCDDDIDGDGIKNTIGIVDESGNINIKNLTWSYSSWTTWGNTGSWWILDNCPLIINPNQQDTYNTGMGDVCGTINIEWVGINTRVIGTGANKKILASAIVDYTPLEENRKRTIHGQIFYGKQVLFAAPKEGIYRFDIESTKDQRRKASNSVVIKKEKENAAFAFILASTRTSLPIIITTLPNTIWGDRIIWELQGPQTSQQETDIWQGTNFLLRIPWKYTINALLKNGNSTIAVAKKDIIVDYSNFELYNTSLDKLQSSISIPFTMFYSWSTFQKRDINWWDGNSSSSANLSSQQYVYNQTGTYTVQSTITTRNQEQIHDIKTITIESNNTTWSAQWDKLMNINLSTYKSNINQPITISWLRNWYNMSNIIKSFTHNGMYKTEGNTFIYNKPWVYYPVIYETIGVCEAPTREATVVIEGPKRSSCIEMALNNIPPISDIDGDGIDDICDDDIDGDGHTNIIGFLDYTDEYLTAYYNGEDTTWIQKYTYHKDLFSQHFQLICSLDNCPLMANNDQISSDGSGAGDVCKDWYNNEIVFIDDNNTYWSWNLTGTIIWSGTIIGSWSSSTGTWWTILDSDGDGIPDNQDQCPFVREIINGYMDDDGCPEWWANNICEITTWWPNISSECNMCPCQYITQSSDLLPWDIIRSSLWALTWNLLQSWSVEQTLEI